MALTALSNNPKLQECTPQSFLGAMMQAAQLGVEPNTPLGQAYMIPYRNKGQMECQFQLG
jgi:recombination protein RecT